MEKELIQLPPLPADCNAEVIKAILEYVKLSKEEQVSVMNDLRMLLGDKGEHIQFPVPDRKVEAEEIEDYVEAIRALMRSLIHEASDIASWVCVRKYMDGYTLDQMIEEQPQAKDFIFIMDTLFEKKIGPADDLDEKEN